MIKPLEKKDFKGFMKLVLATITGFVLALVLFAVLFLKTHWTGFMKFVTDPAFFDQVQIENNYQLKK